MTGFTKILSILCRFAFLVLLSFYSAVPIILACAFEFPQTMNISVKSNAFGLHAILNNVRRNTQEFSMILIFACAFFY